MTGIGFDHTEPGMLLGTIGYLAPEQARGLPVDHRADIFSLGVVLYEMLAGRTAFHRATTADTLSAILKEDPADLPVAERRIPPAVVRIVERCLEKDPTARFQTAADLGFALESLSSSSDRIEIDGLQPLGVARPSREPLAWMVAAILGAVAVAAGMPAVRHLREAPPPPAHSGRFQVTLPADTQFTPAAALSVSSDGQHVVFAAATGGAARLWVRPLGDLSARELPGTDGGTSPFWSPDGRWIGFFAGGKLNKIQIDGGPPVVVANTPGRDGGWHDDTILFAVPNGPIQRVAAGGGAAFGGDDAPRWRNRPPDARFSARWAPFLVPRHQRFRCREPDVHVVDRIAGFVGQDTAWAGRVEHSIRLRPSAVRARGHRHGAALRPIHAFHDRRPVRRRRRCLSGQRPATSGILGVPDRCARVPPRRKGWEEAHLVQSSGSVGGHRGPARDLLQSGAQSG